MWHLTLIVLSCSVEGKIPAHERQTVDQAYNPQQTSSSESTPIRTSTLGNGNFAFGADITGL
ncbi:hypothetical protein NEUTE2DRAFT_130736 [Neurospora tetrasperma FGSC 2509]|nr:hypothetical protein NEUTE2DRAFT_130736 [Neurospora tetrasperma FGSC 2509]